MKKNLLIIVIVVAAAASAVIIGYLGRTPKPAPAQPAQPVVQPAPTPETAPPADAPPPAVPSAPGPAIAPLAEPIAGALDRVTKKPFGLEVSPGHSPVTPERFSGFHTGVDFETTPAEQTADVPIHVVCSGALALKERASGYGGVAVQRCVIDGSDVTVIYGHLRLESIAAKPGDALEAGDELGVLGTGYSAETDGERKHLHLAIHLGRTVDIRGYVRTAGELKDWIDPLPLLRPAR